MGYNETILTKIESELALSVSSFLGSSIKFNGEIAFYDHDWIKKQYGKDVTPFALTLESSDTRIEGVPITTNQYAIGFLCKDKLRDEYQEIFDDFYKTFTDYSFTDSGVTYYIRPTDNLSSVAFSEGSGKAEKRFEQIIRLEVVIVTGIKTGKDITIEYGGGEPLPFKSFKILNGISSYAMASKNYSNNENNFNNKMSIVVEVYINNEVINAGFLNATNTVNIEKTLEISAGFYDIYVGNARYDGYEMSGEYNNILTAYLYFTCKPEVSKLTSFTIDGLAFPIIDYSIGAKNVTKSINVPNSNLTKDVYLGKARAYVFNVLKTNVSGMVGVYNIILNSLLGNGDEIDSEFLTLGITYSGTTYSKLVSISEISDDSSNKGIWRITMTEGTLL